MKEKRMRQVVAILFAVMILIYLSGCGKNEAETSPVNLSDAETSENGKEQPQLEKNEDSEMDVAEPTEDVQLEGTTVEADGKSEAVADIDYTVVKPDESREIMVIMYHNLGEKNTEYGRTPESFRADLQRLYDMGFRTVSMSDYINNNFEVAAGYTPVVLTFDDGHVSNFNYLEENGTLIIDPNCVVGIMNDFEKEHPDFGKNAIFYLNYGNAFGQEQYRTQKIEYLLANGYEIGNHALSHDDLSSLDAAGIQKALGKNAKLYSEEYPGVEMTNLALPYGKRPKDEVLRNFVRTGEYEGYTYKNDVILLVGWKPTYPIYNVSLDTNSVHRVQSGDGEMQLTWWLDQYEIHPEKRFISDGMPNRISVPDARKDEVNPELIGDRELYFYEIENNVE